MSTEVRIPGLGAGMEEGKIVEWYVADGATVQPGDLLYSIETEKTTTDVEAQNAGKVKIIGQADEIYPVGEVIALIE